MSEAIILYRGRGGVNPELLKPTTITQNGIYEAPVTGTYQVSCVGGGGGGGGGCRNSWNPSQVFYGSAGARGSLTTTNVTLNAGDKIQVNLGAGGVGGTNNTTVVSNNSRGTNGGTGGTTTFGSLVSGAGGTYGQWSWHYHYTNSVLVGTYYNVASMTNNYCHKFNIGQIQGNHNTVSAPTIAGEWYISNFTDSIDGKKYCYAWAFVANANRISNSTTVALAPRYDDGKITYNLSIYTDQSIQGQSASLLLDKVENQYRNINANNGFAPMGPPAYYNTIGNICKMLNASTRYINAGGTRWVSLHQTSAEAYNTLKNMTGIAPSKYTPSYFYPYYITFMTKVCTVSERYRWNNTVQNVTTRCYTSIQQGTWWYQDSNTVLIAGTNRAYRGDGGASGQAGNAGFILIIPPEG